MVSLDVLTRSCWLTLLLSTSIFLVVFWIALPSSAERGMLKSPNTVVGLLFLLSVLSGLFHKLCSPVVWCIHIWDCCVFLEAWPLYHIALFILHYLSYCTIIILHYSSLSLVIFFALTSPLADMNIAFDSSFLLINVCMIHLFLYSFLNAIYSCVTIFDPLGQSLSLKCCIYIISLNVIINCYGLNLPFHFSFLLMYIFSFLYVFFPGFLWVSWTHFGVPFWFSSVFLNVSLSVSCYCCFNPCLLVSIFSSLNKVWKFYLLYNLV